KEIKGDNPAVPGNDEISPGVSWCITRAARYPLEPPAIAHFLGLGDWLVSKVRVCSPDRACNAIDLVATTVDTPFRVVEHAIISKDLVDGRAATSGVVFTEDFLKIARQQGRYAGGHGLSPLGHQVRLALAAPVSFGRWLSCGLPLALSENTPVLLTCPLLESMPFHLWEIAAQALDVGGIPCPIEPLEHQSHIFALGT